MEKRIHDRVIFLGKQDKVNEKLATADVMLLPSQLESFGLVALEAMACQVVPITTNVGGLPEVVEHGKTGFMSKVGDVEEMARYAVDLLSDDAKLKQMGSEGRTAAQGRFCSTRIIPLYEKFYRGVLERASE